MRTLTIPAALLLATVLAAGCSDQSAPTELSEGELGPEFRQAPVVLTFSFEEIDINPCTGLEHTHFVVGTFREHENPNGQNFHFNAHAQFDEVTSDGFSGSTGVETFVVKDEGTLTVTDVGRLNLSNDSHQRIRFHFQFHLTISNGDVERVFIDKFSSTCVGKPNA